MQDKIILWRERALHMLARIKAQVIELRHRVEHMSDTNYALGLKYLNEGSLTDAVFRFTIASWTNPMHADAWYWLGAARYGKGELRKSAFALKKARNLRKNDITIESLLTYAEGRATPEQPLIMPLLASHAAQLHGVHAASLAGSWSEQEFAHLLASERVFGYALFLSGVMAGFILGRHAADEGEVLTFAVLPDHRRKGYARMLLDALLKEAKQRGVRSLYLEVAVSNIPAITLYQAAQFTAVGERKDYYLRADGHREDAVILRRNG